MKVDSVSLAVDSDCGFIITITCAIIQQPDRAVLRADFQRAGYNEPAGQLNAKRRHDLPFPGEPVWPGAMGGARDQIDVVPSVMGIGTLYPFADAGRIPGESAAVSRSLYDAFNFNRKIKVPVLIRSHIGHNFY